MTLSKKWLAACLKSSITMWLVRNCKYVSHQVIIAHLIYISNEAAGHAKICSGHKCGLSADSIQAMKKEDFLSDFNALIALAERLEQARRGCKESCHGLSANNSSWIETSKLFGMLSSLETGETVPNVQGDSEITKELRGT